MPRIRLVPREDFDPELAEMVAKATDDLQLGHVRVFAHLPEVAKAWLRFTAAVRTTGTLPRRLVELVRLRVAFHNQCPHCMAIRSQDAVEDGLSDELVCSLERPEEAPDLTDAERMALRYADIVALDHFAADDALFEELRAHFTEAQIVELGVNTAMFVGFGRLGHAWQVTEELPERYRSGGAMLHFGDDGIVVPS